MFHLDFTVAKLKGRCVLISSLFLCVVEGGGLRRVGWAVVGAGGGERGGGLPEKAPIAKTNSNLGATKSAKRFHE